ncbi:MAG: hypothetical protein M3357_15620 [Actinomycetota bacterium]|nr:hypothetical protein [Actinomycetota bacterium]
MGGASVMWRLVRQVVLLMTVAALGVVAIAPAVASTTGSGGMSRAAVGATVHRLTLVPEAGDAAGADTTFTVTLESSTDGGASWEPAGGEQVSFAYVTDGAGLVTAVNGGPVGAMTCATDTAGHCSITVRTEVPGEAVVTATVGSLSASAWVAD